jgi:hypothetical protein
MTTVNSTPISEQVYFHLSKLDKEYAFRIKPSALQTLPQFADVPTKTLSQYIARWKKKQPAFDTSQSVENSTVSVENEVDTYVEPPLAMEIPTEITTELIEQETLKQYYMARDPKDKQRLLSIMQTIWAIKHKVPTENTNKTQSMEDLLARVRRSRDSSN